MISFYENSNFPSAWGGGNSLNTAKGFGIKRQCRMGDEAVATEYSEGYTCVVQGFRVNGTLRGGDYGGGTVDHLAEE